MFSDKKCSFWEGLAGYNYDSEGSEDSTPKPIVSFVKDSPPNKKKKTDGGKPWSHLEEPMDVEHDFENITVDDIDMYGKFVRTKVSVGKSPHKLVSNYVLRKLLHDKHFIIIFVYPCYFFSQICGITLGYYLHCGMMKAALNYWKIHWTFLILAMFLRYIFLCFYLYEVCFMMCYVVDPECYD